MANAEREPITGIWWKRPGGVQGKTPGQGVKGANASEADEILANNIHI